MNKSYLERKIEETASEEVEIEWATFINTCANHPIGKHLRIGEGRLFSGQSSGHSGQDILRYWADDMGKEDMKKRTNAWDVMQKRKEEITKKKTEDILNKISSFNYLFD